LTRLTNWLIISFKKEAVQEMKSNSIARFVSILVLLKEAQQKVGKTFIQKAIYILQEGFGIDLGYRYKLHLFGPYSDGVEWDLNILENGNYITILYDINKEGYQISITEDGEKFIEKYSSEIGHLSEKVKKTILKILELVKTNTAREIELFGTVLYFTKITKDREKIIKSVQVIKPYFQEQQIEKAIESIKKVINIQ